MKANKYILAAIFASGLMFSSCENVLETELDDTILIEEARETPAAMLNGVYRNMGDVAYYGRNFQIMLEAGTDNVVAQELYGRFEDHYYMTKNVRTTESDLEARENLYNKIYSQLVNTHMLLETEGITDDMKGQALFLRAFLHFDLVRLYGAVPLVTNVLSWEERPQKASVQAIYEQIEKDLEEAEGLIENEDKGKATVNAVHALRTRVFMFMADEAGFDGPTYYGKVIAEADKVTGELIENGKFYDYYNGLQNDTETIFELRFQSHQTRGSNNLGSFYREDSYGSFTANPELEAMFDATDDRKAIFSAANDTIGNIFVHKFFDAGAQGLHSPKLLRYTEVLLNKAEALVKTGDGAGASTILQQIKDERGDLSATPATATVADVLIERRKEFAFEGHRIFDLRRNNLPIFPVDLVDGTSSRDVVPRDGLSTGVAARTQQFWLPIPNREILANPNLNGNNHGY